MLEFESDGEVLRFHDQLTGMMRIAMNTVGGPDINDDEALKLTNEFFERYALVTDVLNHVRDHLSQNRDK